MLAIALLRVAQNPFRYIATALAIILGIAFFTATSVLTTSFEESLNSSIEQSFEDVDASVRSTNKIETPVFDARERIPASLADDIAEVEGVAGVFPYLAGYAQAVTAEGKTVGGADANAQGLAWIDDPETNPFAVVQGRGPATANEIVIDADTFDSGSFALGQSVWVLPAPAALPYTVVGVIEDREGSFPGQVVSFTLEGALPVLGTSDVDQIFVDAAEGLDPETLVARINQHLGGEFEIEAVTGQTLVGEFQDVIGSFARIIEIALQIFAGVALVVGAFVIYNTFTITVAQRMREMALLRAIGASRRQVTASVMAESTAIGLVASALGAAAGIGIGWILLRLLSGFLGDLSMSLYIPTGQLVGGVALGTVITVAAAYFPARRGARVDPVQALRETATETAPAGYGRTIAGLVVLAVGLVIAVWAAVGGNANLFIGAIPLVVIAAVVLGPSVVRPLGRVLAAPLVRTGSITAELARDNASRNPKRTASTSLTLMIGVALIATAAMFAATLSSLIAGDLEEELLADHVAEINSNLTFVGAGLDPVVATNIAAIDGVDAAVGVRDSFAEIDGSFTPVTGATTADLASVVDLEVVDGTVTGLGADEVAVSVDDADDEGLAVGDRVTVRFQQGAASLTVAGIYDRGNQLMGSWLVDNAALDAHLPRSLDTRILIRADRADAALLAEIEGALAGNPTASVSTRNDYIDDQAGQLDSLLTLLYALLGMSVVVALLGIVNTMSLSIYERTRELGLLRAVGMTSRQLRRTVRYESAIISLIGTMAGLGLGIFLGWAAFDAIGVAYSDFTVPWGSLIAIGITGLVAGLLSGVLPARRAGRLEVLEAIAEP